MIMKLGMEQYVLKLYKVYINDDPGLTMSHFKTMSNFAKLVFVLKQWIQISGVNFYRTIGPLVSDSTRIICCEIVGLKAHQSLCCTV